MFIKMICIDHNSADISIREKFALPKTRAIELINNLMKNKTILGCIAISTCNRTEIWVSHKEDDITCLEEELCKYNKVSLKEYEKFFIKKKGESAINHLFELACGLKSKIICEDQIISQIKDAVEISREINAIDSILEVLFRNAITAAKKVKTDIKINKNPISVIDSALKKLEQMNIDITKRNALVIGNGGMGRLAVTKLIEKGVNVTMTLREHHKGDVIIPVGCSIAKFSERIDILPNYDLIFSTTATNRYMIRYEDILDKTLKNGTIFIDLAVPRDIDERIFNIEGILGFNIDQIENNFFENMNEILKEIRKILNVYIEQFCNWYYNRDLNHIIFETSEAFSSDVLFRLNNIFKKYDEEDYDNIKVGIKKSIEKLIFSMRDNCDYNVFKNIINIIENGYLKGDK